MLKYLHIENIAVIEQTDIEFSDGFNVLTGETGAGKSIIIDSINAVLGERTSKDLIRFGCDSALVSALFGNFSQENINYLSMLGITPDEDGNFLITRKLSLKGNGLIKVNSKPVTAAELREIAAALINIHGQHDNQALLNPDKHCGYIDAMAENVQILEEYYEEFKLLNKIRKELTALQTDENEKQHKIDLLEYQIKELNEASVNVGEYDSLKEKLKIAENYEQTTKTVLSVLQLLNGDDSNDGALQKLKIGIKSVSRLNDSSFDKTLEELNEMVNLGDEITDSLYSMQNSLNSQDFNADLINQRLDLLQKLMLKYGNTEQAMLDYLENAKAELNNIAFSEQRISELSLELENSKLKLVKIADKLSASRKDAAKRFETQVCDVLKYLNMPSVQFSVSISQGRYTKTGCDVVEFLISTNAGEALKPLHKIASGGELSRIMLAIKSCLLDKDTVETMIFDEIDSGISGFAADKVAVQLKKVAGIRQVICISHLAQIAAKAATHHLIEKRETGGRTFTKVTTLSYNERIAELARIMSGSELTENLYNSAKEMLDRSF